MWRLLLGTMGVKSLVQGLNAAATGGFEPRTVWSEVRRRNRLATAPSNRLATAPSNRLATVPSYDCHNGARQVYRARRYCTAPLLVRHDKAKVQTAVDTYCWLQVLRRAACASGTSSRMPGNHIHGNGLPATFVPGRRNVCEGCWAVDES